jgi:hypothetical protein
MTIRAEGDRQLQQMTTTWSMCEMYEINEGGAFRRYQESRNVSCKRSKYFFELFISNQNYIRLFFFTLSLAIRITQIL